MPAALPNGDEVLGGAQRLQEAVRAVGERLTAEAGETVVRQGDVGAAIYVVESGALDVVVEAGDDIRLPVARLGPGSHFGEMSLLTGTPVSADVVACEHTVLYAAGGDAFGRLIDQGPELLGCLAGELAARLQRTNEQLAAQQQHHAALGRLVASHRGCPFKADLPSLARSTSATDAAADDRPVLITGEEGVGRRALAQHIHSLSRRADRALLVVDCAGLAAEEARQQLFGDAKPTGVTRFAERLGFLQAADGGTLVLADVDRLPLDAQADLAVFLATSRPPGSPCVSLRIIATASRSLDELEAQAALDAALANVFSKGHAIGVVPLRKRRRDIVPLAEHLLQWTAQRRGQAARTIGEGACRELQGYDFAFGNAAELRQVIELAANLAEGEAISAEHLFFGPTGAEAPQIDLLRWPSVERAALDGRLLGWLKALVAVGFAGIVVACLVASQHPIGRLANLLIWGVWWPGLIISLLLLGRAWCAICPLSSGAEVVQRVCGRNLAPSDRLSRIGPVFALVGLVGIVWVEEATDMAHHPTRTALLLLSLALAAALVGWLYQRHAWCRYLCPLGAMGGVFAVVSGLRVRARREVCAASCTGHECYKGTDTSEGCPMFSHALYLTSGQHCKLCLRCLQDCPHRSPRLVLQPPLRDMWRSDLLSPDLVPLAAVIGVLVLLLAATRTASLGMPGGSLWFAVGCAIIAAFGLALIGLFTYRRRTDSSRDISWTSRVAYAYAPAAGAVLLAFRLHALPGLSDLSLRLTAPGGSLLALTLLQLAQGLTVALGGAMTLWALWPVSRLRFEGAVLKAAAAWMGLSSLAVACLVLALSWLA